MTNNELADQFFADCEKDERTPNDENLRAWLWFVCPAHLREKIEKIIRADERLGARRSDVIRLRVTSTEKATIQHSADEAGLTISQYIRSKVL